MKARVKATGEIINVEPCGEWTTMHGDILTYKGDNGVKYSSHELSFKIDDVKEKSFPKDEDYWTRLEHQYAGMAMQGLISDSATLIELGDTKGVSVEEVTAKYAIEFARALVEKLKEESK